METIALQNYPTGSWQNSVKISCLLSAISSCLGCTNPELFVLHIGSRQQRWTESDGWNHTSVSLSSPQRDPDSLSSMFGLMRLKEQVLTQAAPLWLQLGIVEEKRRGGRQERSLIFRFQIESEERDLQGSGFLLPWSPFFKYALPMSTDPRPDVEQHY